ncbi:MAG: hypothetical protein KAG53_04685 [Endozoicomonadaceae bacterium]|nr:hypothetical protein [Endozoicomonadaceae bacterium]
MNEVKFSGISAFSYVWNKNKEESYLHRFCSALAAGIVGFCFGYKVNIDEVKSVLIQHERAYFNTEYKKELAERHIKVNNPALRYETDPHTGVFYGERFSIEEEKYTTKDVEGVKDQKIVEVTIGNRSSAFMKYDYVTTDSNVNAFNALDDTLNLLPEDKPGSSVSYKEITEKVCDAYDINSSTHKHIPEFIFIDGNGEKQHEYVKKEAKDSSVVVINPSEINYQEQMHPHHNIKDDIERIYGDSTFGPLTVQTETGGVEFLAHTLIKSNAVEFSGPYCDFFRDASTDCELRAIGGYYRSKLDKKGWYQLTEKLINSDTKAEGFCWGTATKDQDEKWKVNGKTIYQIGGILPGYYHEVDDPTSEFKFLILFFQIRNALIYETSTRDSIVVHTATIGQDIPGNKSNISMVALQAAILSLPEENRGKVKNVYFGSFNGVNDQHIFSEFGNKTSKQTSVQDLGTESDTRLPDKN